MPKGEFHLHLEGALPYSLLRDKDRAKYAAHPVSWDRDYRFPSFAHFDRDLLAMAGDWFVSTESYHRAAKAVFDDALEQGVIYLETSIASGCLEYAGLDLREVCRTVKSAVPRGLEVRLFLGIHHGGYTKGFAPAIEASLKWDDLDGYDLHGNEPDPLGGWAADFYRRAREAKKITKCHAGEFMGPGFIRRAVEELGVTRLEHGVRAVEDEETLALLRGKKITLDVCPVSNVKLGVSPSFEDHPLKTLARRGVTCTVNRDDPLLFGSTLEEEYHLIQKEMGFSDGEIFTLVRNGFDAALVAEETRTGYHKKLDAFIEGIK